jgi:hypothetical protein
MAYEVAKPFRTIPWGQKVRESWGDKWSEPDVVYAWSNGRTFQDSGANAGPYNISAFIYVDLEYVQRGYFVSE